ncbi:unnamed protein product [Macrosiphum euphorbiae]|uniref:Uncharacterized protein n=1 Tax=Macrosiphum euphorbiae TaxID=13131 RepID=A0AAV0X6F7_9HEMI|nr:unnamed protein product [Macrosiphum euphorbiae]
MEYHQPTTNLSFICIVARPTRGDLSDSGERHPHSSSFVRFHLCSETHPGKIKTTSYGVSTKGYTTDYSSSDLSPVS